MNWVSRLVRRLRALTSRASVERELDDELRFHIEMQTEENLRMGMSPEEARRQAVLSFGGVEGHKEASRDTWRVPWLDELTTDVRFALRYFRRTPLVTVTILLVLSLGLGAGSAVYALLDSALTQPPPGIPRDDAVVRIRPLARSLRPETLGRVSSRQLDFGEMAEYGRHEEIFASVAAEHPSSGFLDFGEGHIPAGVMITTGDFFGTLGVKPVVGRTLNGSGAEADPLVAVISETIWRRYYARSANVVGQKLQLNGYPFTIVGVAPARFRPQYEFAGELVVWVPPNAQPLIEKGREWTATSAQGVVARLRPDVTPSEATTAVRTIASTAGDSHDGQIVPLADVVPIRTWNSRPGGSQDQRAAAVVFPVFALLILLITCTNVSSLLSGAAVARRREIASRLSLGATRARIVRQLLTESVLLTLMAGLLGLVVLWAAMENVDQLGALTGGEIGYFEIVLEWRVVLFTFGYAIGTGLLFGLSPALHATRVSIVEVLKDSAAAVSGSRMRLQRGLVVAQVALTQPMLVGLGAIMLLLAGEWQAPRAIEAHLASLTLSAVDRSRDAADPDLELLARRFEQLPGVVAAAPVETFGQRWTLAVDPAYRVPDWRAPATLEVSVEPAAENYFLTVDRPIVLGRDFLEAERSTTPPGLTRPAPGPQVRPNESIIISEDLATRLWGSADPIGRRFRVTQSPTVYASGEHEITVVGVVGGGVAEDGSLPQVFVPNPVEHTGILVRTVGPAEAIIPQLRGIVTREAPELAVHNATTVAAEASQERIATMQLSAAAAAGGALALVLAAIGLFGVISFTVQQRTREIGIRTAIGAGSNQIVRMFFAIGLKLALIGLVLGLPLSALGLHALESFGGDEQIDELLIATLTAVTVLAITAAATWVPARRAATVDPLVALRSD